MLAISPIIVGHKLTPYAITQVTNALFQSISIQPLSIQSVVTDPTKAPNGTPIPGIAETSPLTCPHHQPAPNEPSLDSLI